MTASPTRPLNIALYAAITSAAEQGAAAHVYRPKARAAQALDVAAAFVRPRPRIHFHSWAVNHSNKGDILIRETVKRRLADLFAPRPVAFTEVGWGDLETAADRIAAQCDLLVIAGSGYLFPSAGRFPQRLAADARALERIGCPKIAFGIGWNTILGDEAPLDEESVDILRRLAGALDLVSVRDRNTAERVSAFARTPAVLTGDPVLLFERPGPAAKSDGGKLRIGVNLALHGPVSAANAAAYIAPIAECLKRVERTFPATFHYVAHAPSERMAWWLLRAHSVATEWNDPTPLALPAFYRSLDVHFGQMMHSAIAAMAAHTPAMAMAYDRKTIALYDLMGLAECCVPIAGSTADGLYAVFENAILQRARLRERICQRLDELSHVTDGYLQSVRTLASS